MHRTIEHRKPNPRYNGIRWVFFGSMACLLITLLTLRISGRIEPIDAAPAEEHASFLPVIHNGEPATAVAAKSTDQGTINAPEITLAEYERIAPGMTQPEVMAVVGNDGQMLVSSGTGTERTMMRLYRGADTSRAAITYRNSIVVTKAELGLR